MRIFNTMSRCVEECAPLDGRHVRLYTCGPTVYDYAHIGNFRAYVFEDVLRRQLKASGFHVTQVMNLTDVDDKTIRGSRQAGLSLAEYTGKFKKAFFEDLKTLNIEPAEHYPAATEHIGQMVSLIGRLFDRGYAYKSDDGSVYFNVGKFAAYGGLSHLDLGGMRSGARVSQDEYDKENLADFALWKAWDEGDGDVVWDSPWGRGRPGWHIECSAMSMQYLGESFDMHTGGIDNMFPHHENEIAQSEAATGKQFVKYWMHCGFLVVDGAKMSKSLGNFYTLRQLLDRGYTGREVRYALMCAQYRQQLNFTFAALDAARSALERLDEFRGKVEARVAERGEAQPEPDWVAKARKDFHAALDDDLNMPEALSALFELTRVGNKEMDSNRFSPADALSVAELLAEFDLVLGVIAEPETPPDEKVLALVSQREQARAARDWEEADRVRKQLAALGWIVQDTPRGPRVKKGHAR